MERLIVTAFYGSLTALTLLLAWRGGSEPLKKIAAWLAVDWIAYNLIFETLGPKATPWLTPSVDAAIVICIGAVGVAYRSWVAWAVVVIYAIQAIVTVTGFAENTQGTVAYYGVENSLFVLRLLLVGGIGAHALARRALAGGWRADRHIAGRSARQV
jgi:hypothetical protein